MLKRPLNPKELAVLRQCAEAPATLEDMASRFRRADNKAQANSWARNSVRRPLRMGLLKHVKRGTYGITAKGNTALENGGEVAAPAKKVPARAPAKRNAPKKRAAAKRTKKVASPAEEPDQAEVEAVETEAEAA